MGSEDLVVELRVGVVVCPDDLFVWCDLDENPVPSGADEGIVVKHSLGTAKIVGIEVPRQHILPGEIIRAIGSSRWKIVFTSVVVYIRSELIDA